MTKNLFYKFFLGTILLLNTSDAAFHPQMDKCHKCSFEYETHESFEKVYVNCNSILYMPQGTFFKHKNGRLEKICGLSHDCQGMFFLRIYSTCPSCGKVYRGLKSPHGWSCLNDSL